MATTPMPVENTTPTGAGRAKYRLRFAKEGNLRLVSHHDLMHCFERMLRRAGLPFAVTQGFHPQPRVVFAQALALGIIGLREVVELELTEALEPSAVLKRLRGQTPPGLSFLSIGAISRKDIAQPRRAGYRLNLPAGHEVDIERRCEALLAQTHIAVERTRPRRRRFNLRPLLSDLRVHDGALEMWLWITSRGSARPEEAAQLLGLGSWLDEGNAFTRFDLELQDEVVADAPSIPEWDEEPTYTQENNGEASEEGAPRPHALMAGPLSFDS